uniref:Xylanolytic transcriptional activator regulatory domain-containing protein n=2 Tax=Bionectria ochroleuca TaxID=29856 RepID=A0A0B7JZM6_BIOOC
MGATAYPSLRPMVEESIARTNASETPSSTNAPPSTHLVNTPASRPPRSKKDADAMTGISGDPSSNIEFFGGSSAVSFMRQINSIIDTRLGHSQAGIAETDGYPPYKRQKASQNDEPFVNTFEYVLPQRNLADSLLRDYYDLVWVILPVHDWTIFREAYNSVWLGNPGSISEHDFHCMLNVAFALGSQFSRNIHPRQRRDIGQKFWDRAQALFNPYLHFEASLERVQCLLMMGLFLQSTCESHQCWMTIGSAVRMAQSLGLHLSSSSKDNDGARKVQIARRVWHGCVFMDRVLSMTFGRPSMIANWLSDAVPLPLMIDDDYLDMVNESSAVRPDGKPTEVAFFVKSLELYRITNNSLLELYIRPLEIRVHDQQLLASVLEFDSTLTRWAWTIPDQLCYTPEEGKTSQSFILQRQRIVLRSRYLHSRILILRPVVAEACLKQTHSQNSGGYSSIDRSLSQNMVNQCCTMCFESAHELINIIYDNLDLQTVTGPVPAWWFSVLFIYTAATVLLAEILKPPDPSMPSATSEQRSLVSEWDKAIELLKAYAQVGESAERCVAALEILSSKIHGGSMQASQRAKGISICGGQHSHQATAGNLGNWENPEAPTPIDLGDMDFDVSDMFWLNGSTADILFQ